MTRPPLPLHRRLSPHTHGLGDVAMLTDHDLQRIYELAAGLHPHQGIALAMTLEACERLTLVRRLHDRRTGRYRLRLPEACLPHYCVYLASEAGERDRECPLQGETPVYRPTPDDYLKCLVWRTMDRSACHVAVALGCFLYGYQPGDMASLAPEVFHYHNIRCVKQRLAKQLKTRLQGVPMFRDGPPRSAPVPQPRTTVNSSTGHSLRSPPGERLTSPRRLPPCRCWIPTLDGRRSAPSGTRSTR